jgi:putative FmdB family regulatory protein
MPMYEYTCSHCGEEFEELVTSTTPDDEVECPACEREGGSVRKLSTFAMGSGHGLGSGGSSAGSSAPSSGFS